MEALQGSLFAAVLLDRAGYPVWDWGDQALRRAMDWLNRHGKPQGNGSSVEKHETWIVNRFYGTNYPNQPAGMGRTFGFTDWLYP